MFNVLIVDDDPMVADLNWLFISRVADFHCCGVAATIGDAKAMQAIWRRSIYCCWMSICNRRMAWTCCQALRADGRNIDVIMMTSAADTLTLQTALHYGVVDYLIKPFPVFAL
ncbi:response regulator [Klebsiella variicola subsp. variicola]|nr:response regulator [Klebsiella variicola subsp. variicola]